MKLNSMYIMCTHLLEILIINENKWGAVQITDVRNQEIMVINAHLINQMATTKKNEQEPSKSWS